MMINTDSNPQKTLHVYLGKVPNNPIEVMLIKENKIKRYMEIVEKNDEISFDEFIILKALLIETYESIIIHRDNRFLVYYPLIANLSEEILSELIILNENVENNTVNINDVSIWLIEEIFGEVILENGNYFVAYVDHYDINTNPKISFVEENTARLSLENSSDDNIFQFDIFDYHDYLKLLKALELNYYDELGINIVGSELSQDTLIEKLEILASLYPETTLFLSAISKSPVDNFNNTAYLNILKKYWKKDKFLTFTCYNVKSLSNGEIQTFEVTQDKIINDILEQVDACNQNLSFRDVFVTAPTGAGKSVIFQIPAIKMAEDNNLITLVISPLIGLMNDQVDSLKSKGYKHVATINGDMSPLIKAEIIEQVAKNEIHVLYLSPESLLAKSDIQQLIGDRTIGMIVIDESHIVTTWGKQFRPDYWYLGEFINKLRKSQFEKKSQKFIVSTFTATAIYGGIEDMYRETLSSLHLINPITYLGYIRRSNLSISVKEITKKTKRNEYELDKYENLYKKVSDSINRGEKILIYFPNINNLLSFKRYCFDNKIGDFVSCYFGPMSKEEKYINHSRYLSGESLVMLATKAYGMGIDIDNIVTVTHFAPTGNVCDYVQEIGRAARDRSLHGKAIYDFMSNDFKHINTLHGISQISNYQLVNVIKKVYELFESNLRSSGLAKSRSMLIDAESFSYIFDSPISNEDTNINKVKTALLLIQKDFINRIGYSPFYARPIPIFSSGYFYIDSSGKKAANEIIGDQINEIKDFSGFYTFKLEEIWKKFKYDEKMSFPKFKYLLYSKSKDLLELYNLNLLPAYSVDFNFKDNANQLFEKYMSKLKTLVSSYAQSSKYYTKEFISNDVKSVLSISNYEAKALVDILIVSMLGISGKSSNMHSRYIQKRVYNEDTSYNFSNDYYLYFEKIQNVWNTLKRNESNKKLFVVNNKDTFNDFSYLLGTLESWNLISFKILGGESSQIYIYVNQTRPLIDIIRNGNFYKNKILQSVDDRHKISVAMLKYLFSNKLTSDEIWDNIEKYFLGKIPEQVMIEYNKK